MWGVACDEEGVVGGEMWEEGREGVDGGGVGVGEGVNGGDAAGRRGVVGVCRL